MTDPEDTTSAAVEAADSAPHSAAVLLERLAERLGGKASAAAVFGEPIERDGVTVIPVAAAAFGFGGGTGRETGTGRSGDGGGGGAVARPIGFIEISGGTAVFKPVRDPLRDIVMPLAALLAATTTIRIARALTRPHRRR